MVGVILIILVLVFAKASADFHDEALKLTNKYRALHGSHPLKQDHAANNIAQAYAQKLANSGRFEHSKNLGKYGENIYYGFDSKEHGDLTKHVLAAIKSWYDEEKNYSYQKSAFTYNTGHFTAIVWRSTISQGIGVATAGKSTYVVANYSPPGNMYGKYRENVKPSIMNRQLMEM